MVGRNSSPVVRGTAPVPVKRDNALQRRLARLSREHGSMYHICTPQCQTHFAFRKEFVCGDRRPTLMHDRTPRLRQFANAVIGRFARMQHADGLAGSYRGLGLGRAKGDRSKYSVRAIPWMFGWGLARHTLPGWYGIGHALAAWRDDDPERLALLQRLYQAWPFFHALLNNSQMSLSKVDPGIAREYARLCENPDVETGIYQRFQAEYAQTCQEILSVAQVPTLLEENPDLAKSLERRNPYLDPLNHIQVTLLPRYRQALREHGADSPEVETWLRPLLRSINALAAGMRNTG